MTYTGGRQDELKFAEPETYPDHRPLTDRAPLLEMLESRYSPEFGGYNMIHVTSPELAQLIAALKGAA